METIQEFVDRTKGPLVPYVDSWYPWVYAHHYLRTEMHLLPPDLGVVGPRMLLDEVVELIQVWCGLTGESIEGSARALADAYLERWGVSREQIARARQQRLSVPVVPAEPGQRNQAPVPRSPRGNRVNGGRGAKPRGVVPAPAQPVVEPPAEVGPADEDVTLVVPEALVHPVPEERLVS